MIYHAPLESWLKDFELDTGKRKIKPYDPAVGKQIADMLRASMGEQIPTDPTQIAKAFGRGWWKPDPQAAQELLEKAGFTKRGDNGTLRRASRSRSGSWWKANRVR